MEIDSGFWGSVEITVRLTLAVLLGGALGWDREQQDKPAGLRTHMLVSLGSAVFMLLSLVLLQPEHAEGLQYKIEPSRVLAGIIGGVGFLGAGTIMESRGHVKGITTAASIWLVAGVGIAMGMGAYFVGCLTVGLSLVILQLTNWYKYRALVNQDGSQTSEEEKPEETE